MEDDVYYVFQFKPGINNNSNTMHFTVFSPHKEMLIKFLQQHRFPIDRSYIQVIPVDDKSVDLNDIEELQVYKMGSNEDRSKLFDIVTTPQLMDEATTRVGDLLSAASLFGDLAVEDSLPLVKETKDMIFDLPFGYILDVCGCDPENEETSRWMSKNPKKWKEYSTGPTDQGFYSDGPDDHLIYETLYEQANVQDVHPITVESYIESFVDILTDEYQ